MAGAPSLELERASTLSIQGCDRLPGSAEQRSPPSPCEEPQASAPASMAAMTLGPAGGGRPSHRRRGTILALAASKHTTSDLRRAARHGTSPTRRARLTLHELGETRQATCRGPFSNACRRGEGKGRRMITPYPPTPPSCPPSAVRASRRNASRRRRASWTNGGEVGIVRCGHPQSKWRIHETNRGQHLALSSRCTATSANPFAVRYSSATIPGRRRPPMMDLAAVAAAVAQPGKAVQQCIEPQADWGGGPPQGVSLLVDAPPHRPRRRRRIRPTPGAGPRVGIAGGQGSGATAKKLRATVVPASVVKRLSMPSIQRAERRRAAPRTGRLRPSSGWDV